MTFYKFKKKKSYCGITTFKIRGILVVKKLNIIVKIYMYVLTNPYDQDILRFISTKATIRL